MFNKQPKNKMKKRRVCIVQLADDCRSCCRLLSYLLLTNWIVSNCPLFCPQNNARYPGLSSTGIRIFQIIIILSPCPTPCILSAGLCLACGDMQPSCLWIWQVTPSQGYPTCLMSRAGRVSEAPQFNLVCFLKTGAQIDVQHVWEWFVWPIQWPEEGFPFHILSG